ncbi:hypothetical protein [Flavobacterium sp.]|nr:hypothetical protein [Flavobacterium sp.]
MARTKKVPRIKETLHEERNRMRQEAIELAAKHTNKKPTKFLLK